MRGTLIRVGAQSLGCGARLVLVLVWGAACSRPPIQPSLPWGALEQARSALLLIEGQDGPEAYAVQLSPDTQTASLPDNLAEPALWHLIVFGCPLERLGLLQGRLPLLLEPAEQTPLPAPLALFQNLRSEGVSRWETIFALEEKSEELLRRIDISADQVCAAATATFQARKISAPLERLGPQAHFARALNDGSVLIGAQTGALFLVQPDERVSKLPLLPGAVPLDAYQDDSGVLWVLTERGLLWKGSLQRLEEAGTSPALAGDPENNRARLIGSRRAPPELFVVSDGGSFERFEANGWEALASARSTRAFPAAWIGPSEALAGGVGASASGLLRYKSGLVIEELLPTTGGISALVHDPSAGRTFAGSLLGEVFFLGTLGWEKVQVAGGGPAEILDLVPLTEGALVLGRESSTPAWGQIVVGTGWCPQSPPSEQVGLLVAPLGESKLLVVEHSQTAQTLDMMVLQRTRSQARCSAPQERSPAW